MERIALPAAGMRDAVIKVNQEGREQNHEIHRRRLVGIVLEDAIFDGARVEAAMTPEQIKAMVEFYDKRYGAQKVK